MAAGNSNKKTALYLHPKNYCFFFLVVTQLGYKHRLKHERDRDRPTETDRQRKTERETKADALTFFIRKARYANGGEREREMDITKRKSSHIRKIVQHLKKHKQDQ